MKNDELDSVLGALAPVKVAELADDAYARRPDVALVRARAEASAADRRLVPRRRPVFALGAAAVVAAGAVAAAVVLASGEGTGGDGDTGHGGTADTHAFLLASAETAAKQPAAHGNCWYTRTRMWQDLLPPKKGPGEPTPIGKPRTFRARTASSDENWVCTRPDGTGMRFRTRGPLDIKATFPTKKDEAAWKAAGSPPLEVNGGTTASKPRTVTYDKPPHKAYGDPSHLVNPVIGSHEIAWKSVAKLPATKGELESYLRKMWQLDRRGGANGYVAPAGFGQYVFVSAWDLFMAPTTPGTRAALYRILADDPSVHVTGRIKDREGRSGVGITADGTGVRLVVDPASALLLDYEEQGGGGEYLAFERQGWVDEIGATSAP